MSLPTLGRRLRDRPIDFDRWRRSRATATEADLAGWPLDRYSTTVRAREMAGSPSDGLARFREAVMGLDIFPPGTVELTVDAPGGRATPGAIVVERGYLGPFGLESAVRLTDLQEGPQRVALTWATLGGHPERGIETFSADLRPDGSVEILISARSRPATTLMRITTPFARWLQRRYSRAALAHLTGICRG